MSCVGIAVSQQAREFGAGCASGPRRLGCGDSHEAVLRRKALMDVSLDSYSQAHCSGQRMH